MLYEAHGITKFVVVCGQHGDRIKALLWEGNGFTSKEAISISKHQYRLLLQGLNPIRPKVREVNPTTAF